MIHNMIAILDLGSTQSAQIARDIRALGLYSEIHSNDIAPAALKALPGCIREGSYVRERPSCNCADTYADGGLV